MEIEKHLRDKKKANFISLQKPPGTIFTVPGGILSAFGRKRSICLWTKDGQGKGGVLRGGRHRPELFPPLHRPGGQTGEKQRSFYVPAAEAIPRNPHEAEDIQEQDAH